MTEDFDKTVFRPRTQFVWALRSRASRGQDKDVVIGHEFKVGRADNCDLVLSEDLVSRHHATFYLEDGDLVVEDNNSTNGTYVNSEETKRAVLQIGDVIYFDELSFEVVKTESALPTPAEREAQRTLVTATGDLERVRVNEPTVPRYDPPKQKAQPEVQPEVQPERKPEPEQPEAKRDFRSEAPRERAPQAQVEKEPERHVEPKRIEPQPNAEAEQEQAPESDDEPEVRESTVVIEEPEVEILEVEEINPEVEKPGAQDTGPQEPKEIDTGYDPELELGDTSALSSEAQQAAFPEDESSEEEPSFSEEAIEEKMASWESAEVADGGTVVIAHNINKKASSATTSGAAKTKKSARTRNKQSKNKTARLATVLTVLVALGGVGYFLYPIAKPMIIALLDDQAPASQPVIAQPAPTPSQPPQGDELAVSIPAAAPMLDGIWSETLSISPTASGPYLANIDADSGEELIVADGVSLAIRNAMSGQFQTEITLDAELSAPLTFVSTPNSGNHMFVVMNDRDTSLIDGQGQTIWKKTLEGNLSGAYISGIHLNNWILVPTFGAGVVALNTDNGGLAWAVGTASANDVSTNILVRGQQFYFASETGEVAAFRIAGNIAVMVWAGKLSTQETPMQLFASEDKLVLVTSDGSVCTLDLYNGSERWCQSVGEIVISTPVMLDDSVYLATQSGKVVEMSLANQASQIITDLMVSIEAPLQTIDNHLVLLDGEGRIHLIARSGETVTSVDVEGASTYLNGPIVHTPDRESGSELFSLSTEGTLTRHTLN